MQIKKGTLFIRIQNQKPTREMKLKYQENGKIILTQMQYSCFDTQHLPLTVTEYIMTENMLLKWKVILV